MPCVQPFAVNPLNFLRWHPVADVTFPFAVPLEYCEPPRPACGVVIDALAGYGFPTLPVVAGDVLSFFINSDEGIDITNGPETVALGLAQNGKLVTPNVGSLLNIPDRNNATGYFLFGSIEIGCQPDGRYWPVIYDVNDKHVLLIANPLEIVNWQNWTHETSLVKFRHPFSLYGVNYTGLPSFYQEFRLSMTMSQPTIPFDDETYTDRNNFTRSTRVSISQVFALQTDLWDPPTFRAAQLMLSHRDIFINDTLIKAQGGGLEPDYVRGGEMVGWLSAKGKVLDQNFARTVLSC